VVIGFATLNPSYELPSYELMDVSAVNALSASVISRRRRAAPLAGGTAETCTGIPLVIYRTSYLLLNNGLDVYEFGERVALA
jgi:hypothetical protein